MKGKDLKALVSAIPDEAEVAISGPDCGGYDVQWCKDAMLNKDAYAYFLFGNEQNSDNYDPHQPDLTYKVSQYGLHPDTKIYP